jgi:hypothetical protein
MQTFFYGDMADLYVLAPDWWQVLVPEGHRLQLKKEYLRDTAGCQSMAFLYLWSRL